MESKRWGRALTCTRARWPPPWTDSWVTETVDPSEDFKKYFGGDEYFYLSLASPTNAAMLTVSDSTSLSV